MGRGGMTGLSFETSLRCCARWRNLSAKNHQFILRVVAALLPILFNTFFSSNKLVGRVLPVFFHSLTL